MTFVGVVVLALLEGGAASQTASPALSARMNPAAQAGGTSKIAFISEPPFGGYCGTVYVMNADGSGQRRLSKAGVPGCGQRMVRLVARRAEDRHRQQRDARRSPCVVCDSKIYVMNADGSGQRRLTRTAGWEHSPAWSPDGRRIAFAGPGDRNSLELYVVNADGSGQRRLTRTCWL